MLDLQMKINSMSVCEKFSIKQKRSALSVVSDLNSMDALMNSTSAFSPSYLTSSGEMQTTSLRPKQVKKAVYKHVPHSEKPAHLVAKRNERERRRVQAVNSAFLRLRKHVPHEPRHKRLSKFKTLKVAIQYIKHMQDLIRAHDNQIQHKQNNIGCFYDNGTGNTRSCHINSKKTSLSSVIPRIPTNPNNNNKEVQIINKSSICSKSDRFLMDSTKGKILSTFEYQEGSSDYCCYSSNDSNSTSNDCLQDIDHHYQRNETEQLPYAHHNYSPPIILSTPDSYTNVTPNSSFVTGTKHSHYDNESRALSQHDSCHHGNKTWLSFLSKNLGNQRASLVELRSHSATPDSVSSLDSWNSGIPGQNFVYSTFQENTAVAPIDLHSSGSFGPGFLSNY